MNKKLFTQIKNEWRTNLWLVTELLVVSVVLWYIVDFFYTSISTRIIPLGFDIEHCYRVDVDEVNVKSPEYIPDRGDEQNGADRMELMERIRRRPEIEAVCWGQNSYPYNGSNSGIGVQYIGEGDTLQTDGYTLRRYVTPDFVRVFRYQGVNGETPEELAAMLKEGKVLINNDLFWKQKVELKDYTGKEFIIGDTSTIKRLGAALVPPRYCDYQTWNDCVVMDLPRWWYCRANELCIRVKPEMDHDIKEMLMKDAPTQFRIGNLMVTDVVSFKDIRRNFQTFYTNRERNYYAGMGFLLLNIFLGLLGTFWFRTQQRVGEIAIRKVNGATDRSIFNRLIGEGLLLLVVATIPAAAIDTALSWYEFNSYFDGYIGWGRTSLCILVTFGLMALMIVLGIIIPARRAMRIKPAIALKDE